MKHTVFFVELLHTIKPFHYLRVKKNAGKSSCGGIAFLVKLHIIELLLY